jgi:hypothetical protein
MATAPSSVMDDDNCVQAFYDTDANHDGCLSLNEWFTLGGATYTCLLR